MSRSSSVIERVQKLREELGEEIAAVDNRMSECRARMGLLERHGTIPGAEATARFERDLEDMARKGKAEFDRMAQGYARSGGNAGVGLSATISTRLLGNGNPNDPGPVLVYLNRDQILADAKKVIGEYCRDEKHQERAVPAEKERRAELRALEQELEQLQKERDELQDELSRSFNFKPSEATQKRERQERKQQVLDALNESSREPGPEPDAVLRSPEL